MSQATQLLRLRRRLAQTTARLIVQEGIKDYHFAKCKAAARLGVPHTKHLPSNTEIEKEIISYQRLFQARTQPQQLSQLRRVAVQAMRLFAKFNPHLVGEVLDGTANQYSDITLHLFAHTSEEVAFFFIDKRIPYRLEEREFRTTKLMSYPCYCFLAGEVTIVSIIFGVDDIRWSPPHPVNGKPMRRADLRTVERLLQSSR